MSDYFTSRDVGVMIERAWCRFQRVPLSISQENQDESTGGCVQVRATVIARDITQDFIRQHRSTGASISQILFTSGRALMHPGTASPHPFTRA